MGVDLILAVPTSLLSGSDSLARDDTGVGADFELIARCQNGDEGAFEELVRKYGHRVFSLVYHYMPCQNDVEDIAQKIFSKIYFSLSKFDNTRPFFPWIYQIAINQCYDELRHSRRNRTRTFSELNLAEIDNIERLIKQGNPPEASEPDRRELCTLLHKMLDQLPDRDRIAIGLRDLESVPYGKMADVLQCTEKAARSRVHRARIRLRKLMERAIGKGKMSGRNRISVVRPQVMGQ